MMIATFAYSASIAQNNDRFQNEKKISIPSRKDWNTTFISDLAASYLAFPPAWNRFVAGHIILSGIMALSYVMLLKWLTKFIIYLAIPTSLITIVVMGFKYVESDKTDNGGPMWSEALYFLSMLIFGLGILCCNRKEIPLACEVMKESIKGIIWFPSLIIIPVIHFILHSVALALSVSVFICLFRIPSLSSDHLFIRLVLSIVNYFGYRWLTSFIDGFIQMILYWTYARWYWTTDKKFVPKNTVFHAAKVVVRYHLGTAALGSFVLVLNQLAGLVMKFLTRGKTCGSSSFIGRRLCPLVRMAFAGIEELTRIISNNSYVVSTLYGKTFGQSASHAYSILDRNNTGIVFLVDQVTSAVFNAGTLFAVGTSTAVMRAIYKIYGIPEENTIYAEIYAMDIHVIPIAVVSSYIIARAVLKVMSSAVEAFILCALEDLYVNDGSIGKPNYMNMRLRSLLIQAQIHAQECAERHNTDEVPIGQRALETCAIASLIHDFGA
ncbi:hypothetical protein QAD02_011130 [Eretmocerus hayati]|uniref:Uncharacterized protein n=1 Tax=Eretmocerus hayati TaxID=131215 RepID=A0ACC2NW86_9HYME|nr:hypothetical protein QAD02_011130 [Eretmocerus hayati]